MTLFTCIEFDQNCSSKRHGSTTCRSYGTRVAIHYTDETFACEDGDSVTLAFSIHTNLFNSYIKLFYLPVT